MGLSCYKVVNVYVRAGFIVGSVGLGGSERGLVLLVLLSCLDDQDE